MFISNALDHVHNLRSISKELLRILAPGGLLIGSFNLNEPATHCEPQTLTENKVKTLLLDQFKILSYRIGSKEKGKIFKHFFTTEEVEINKNKPSVLCVKAQKIA